MSHPVMNQAQPGTDHVFVPTWRQLGRLRKETWSVPEFDFGVAQVGE
jgi:hypothetical protein